MIAVGKARWLTPVLAVLAVALASCTTVETGRPTTPTAPPTAESAQRQVLAAYEEFWTVTDMAFAAPRAQDWTPRIEQVAAGQARDVLSRDVANYASLPAHSEGAITRSPRVTGVADGRAQVLDCVDLGSSRLVSDTDGRPLDDLANRVSRYVYRADLVEQDGRWIVERTEPALDQPC